MSCNKANVLLNFKVHIQYIFLIKQEKISYIWSSYQILLIINSEYYRVINTEINFLLNE